MMPDRDKVIKGLELLAHWPDGLIFQDKEKWIKPCCERAVAMLKEQEAVEPIKMQRMDDNFSFFVPYFLCGNCRYELEGKDVMFCAHCGRKVKWND